MKGVLLVNLGSPESPTAKDVKPYLDEFLMDKYVIDVPFLLRALLVRGIILQTRPKKSAEAYARIWTSEGSPLIVLSKKMQMYATESQQNIRTALEKGEYKKAAMLTWVDLILNKVILKFAGGGTNWIVLNVEKSGLGLIPAIAKKTLFLEKRKNISNM